MMLWLTQWKQSETASNTATISGPTMNDLKMLNHDLTGSKMEAENAIDDVAAYALILGRAEGRAEERAAIVAWLRDPENTVHTGAAMAAYIERGEHLAGDDE